MQKNEENRVEEKKETWNGAEQFLASEIIAGREKTINAMTKFIRCFAFVVAFVIAGLLFVNYQQTKTIEKNNQGWIDYLSEYDFVSQDGEGLNYFNRDVEGSVYNGAENQDEEK